MINFCLLNNNAVGSNYENVINLQVLTHLDHGCWLLVETTGCFGGNKKKKEAGKIDQRGRTDVMGYQRYVKIQMKCTG